MENLFKHKCYEIGYAELSEKSNFFQEITAPKKVPLVKKKLLGRRRICFEKVHFLNNYLF